MYVYIFSPIGLDIPIEKSMKLLAPPRPNPPNAWQSEPSSCKPGATSGGSVPVGTVVFGPHGKVRSSPSVGELSLRKTRFFEWDDFSRMARMLI